VVVEAGGRGPDEQTGAPRPTPGWARWAAMGSAVVLVAVAAVVLVPEHHDHRTSTADTAAAGTTPSTPRHSTTHPARTTTTAGPSRATNAITFTAVGDTGLGRPGELPPDPLGYLDPIKAAIAAPIVFGNLEGTLTSATGSKCGATSTDCVAFRVPTSDATVLHQAGFTVMNSANNHSHDFGVQGATDTSAALAGAGIAQTGLPGQIAVVSDGATKVAFIGFAPYRNVNDLLDLATAKTLIARARTLAAVVVVYMHAGAEGASATHVTGAEETYVGEDRGNAKAFAHAVIDDGADVVIASGPHVLRGIEFYDHHLIDYSMGNFANYHDFVSVGTTSLSGVLKVTVQADGRFVSGSFTSVLLSSTGHATVDPSDQATHLVNSLSAADFGAAAAVIQPGGQITPPAGT
jgi:poly-gamma-glutamate capsule biosynthesis protein CapA/YwtB (metallophosphatase superfamily)